MPELVLAYRFVLIVTSPPDKEWEILLICQRFHSKYGDPAHRRLELD